MNRFDFGEGSKAATIRYCGGGAGVFSKKIIWVSLWTEKNYLGFSLNKKKFFGFHFEQKKIFWVWVWRYSRLYRTRTKYFGFHFELKKNCLGFALN
jgi:hypothetical protein